MDDGGCLKFRTMTHIQSNKITAASILILLTGCISLLYGSSISLRRLDTLADNIFIGDTLEFGVQVNVDELEITGVACYLTMNGDVLKPVLQNGKPFVEGTFITTSSHMLNSTHGDSINLSDDYNGIDGFQLDYYHPTGPSIGGSQPFTTNSGLLAKFKVRVVDVPSNNLSETQIKFDYSGLQNRRTGFYELGKSGTLLRFDNERDYKLQIKVFQISNTLSDTLVSPGQTLQVPLNDYIITSENSYIHSWSLQEIQPLTGTINAIVNDTLNVIINSDASGLLRLRVTAVQSTTNFTDTQELQIGINQQPYFNSPKPVISFLEDGSQTINKDQFVTDPDHNVLTDLTFQFVSQFIQIEDQGASLHFTSLQDWNGTEAITMIVKDPIQSVFADSIVDNFTVTVDPANDDPVLYIDSYDSITVFYSTPKLLSFVKGVHVVDDSNILTWSATSSDTTLLKADFNNNILTLTAMDMNYSGTATVVITVQDDGGLNDSETLTIQLEPVKVVIADFPEFQILPDLSIQLNLNDYVNFPESQKSNLIWSFSATQRSTDETDGNVFFNYNQLNQTVEITAQSGHQSLDNLIFTVTASENNFDRDTTTLRILLESSLNVLDLPAQTLIQNTQTILFDLDDYVLDPTDDPADIQWTSSGGDSLERIEIDTVTHELIITTNATFSGLDSLYCIATNTSGVEDSSQLIINCIPYSPSPVFSAEMPDTTFYWKQTSYQFYKDLDEYIWDMNTHDSLLVWTFNYDTSYLNLNFMADHRLFLQTKNKTGNATIVCSVTNASSYTSRDTIVVTILSFEPPIWRMIPSITMTNSEICSTLTLNQFCSDLTGAPLTYQSTCSVNDLQIQIDTLSSKVKIIPTHGFNGFASLIFKASNEDTSSVSNLISIEVEKSTSLACFVNPVVDWHVNFTAITSPDAMQFDYLFEVDSTQSTLAFTMIDSTANQKVWNAPYQFTQDKDYFLRIQIAHRNGIVVHDSLWFITPISKTGILTLDSETQNLQIKSLSQEKNWYYLSRYFAETDNQQNRILYHLKRGTDSDQPFEICWTNADLKQTGCYEIIANEIQPVTTYKDGDRFIARISGNHPFFFDQSGTHYDIQLLKEKIQCYPNPFNHQIQLNILLDINQQIQWTVYNILGQVIYQSRAVDAEKGLFSLDWDGRNQTGFTVPSGMYFIQIRGEHFKPLLKKVTLLR